MNVFRFSLFSVLILIPIVLLFSALALLAVNVPYWDDYSAIVKYLGWDFPERMCHLFDFHNEHRIVTVRLFLEAMVAVTGKVNFKVCMMFGTAQLLVVYACFALAFLRQFGKRFGLILLSLAAWHLFSMLNFDNAFWALTALENFGVLMWVFLAITFVCRAEGLVAYSMAWVFAVLAALTSAQGLAVFGVMILASLAPGGTCGSWREMWQKVWMRRSYRVVMALLLSVSVALLYFRGFPSGSKGEIVASGSVIDKVLYVVAFLGNLVPIYPVALLCGCCVVVAIGYVVWNFPKLPVAMRPVFLFMVYCVGVMVSGTFFRASDPREALSFRYYVITACLFISLVGSLLSLQGRVPRIFHKCLPVMVIGFCFMDLAVFCIGWPMFTERNEALRVNILTWPRYVEGLRIEENDRDAASNALKLLEEKGLYDHKAVLYAEEILPQKPIRWPSPHFP